MSLPLLVSGADCGPVNPLQGLSKNLDRDRGIQQDFIGSSRAGSSQETFRTQYTPSPAASQEAARFFTPQTSFSPPPPPAPSAYDLSALHATLVQSTSQGTSSHNALPQAGAAPWAADFMQQQPLLHSPSPRAVIAGPEVSKRAQQQPTQFQAPPLVPHTVMPQFSSPVIGPRYMNSIGPIHSPGLLTPSTSQHSTSHAHLDIAWDKEFESQESLLSSQFDPQAAVVVESQPVSGVAQNLGGDADELARTAGLLIHTVRDEQNPKFKNSQFMGLMRKLRDKEAVIEGKEIVHRGPEASGGSASTSDWAKDFSAATVDAKGKGRAIDPSSSSTAQLQSQLTSSLASSSGGPVRYLDTYMGARQAPSEASQEPAPAAARDMVDPNDEYFFQENEDYIKYWTGNVRPVASDSRTAGQTAQAQQNAQAAEWDLLQRDWEAFEATAAGLRAVSKYKFEERNPYLSAESSRTRHHMMHSAHFNPVAEGILEHEAAVLRDPQNAMRWFELGVKQQENEREQQAFHALQRSLELDGTYLPAWLALAVSHTNEGNRSGTYDAVNEWLGRNERYRGAIERHRRETSSSSRNKFNDMIQCLLTIVQQSAEIDADVQIALAVLLNTNESWDKARDCFKTALAVRPDDWQLYNRVGATLANGGHAEEALDYYYRALDLNPAYIRARYNLGISCINLKRYEEGAQHLLDGLVLQESETSSDPNDPANKRGVTSSTLWDTLRNCCLQMQRSDLASMCDARDLDAFQLNFQLA